MSTDSDDIDDQPASGRSQSLLAGGYETLLSLASGGMAHVFVGRRVAGAFERLVVIKQVHRHLLHEKEFADLFRDEAQIASRIHHANVVPVVDVVEAPNELLLVMDYVESVSLATLRKTAAAVESPSIPAPIVSRIVIDVLSGLHAAHELLDDNQHPLDVVHRDVSPQNIIVGVDGVSRVIDFGVAKAAHRITKSESGDIKGKYGYMSPEQASGLEIDRRTDIFAAGVVLFETLTDQRLFSGENPIDSINRVLNAPLPDFNETPGVPPSLVAVLKRALDRNRQRRFSTTIQFAEAVETAVPPASHRQVADFVRLHCGQLLLGRRNFLEESRRRAPAAARTPRGRTTPALETAELSTIANTAATVPSTAGAPIRWSRGLTVLALIATVLLAALWGVKRASSVTAAPPPAASSAPEPPPAPSAAVSEAVLATSAPKPSPSSQELPPQMRLRGPAPAPPPKAPTRAPAAAAPSSELQQDPYGQ